MPYLKHSSHFQLTSSNILKQEVQLSLGKADSTAYVRSPATDFQSRRESDLSETQRWRSSMHAMSTEHCLESYNERYNRHHRWSFRQAI